MHNKELAHRDIKLQNIVLVKPFDPENIDDMEIKLIDFGLADRFHRNKMKKCNAVGTPDFIAPEVIKGSFN